MCQVYNWVHFFYLIYSLSLSIQRHTRIDSGIICIIDRRFIIRHDFDLYRSFQQKKGGETAVQCVCVCGSCHICV